MKPLQVITIGSAVLDVLFKSKQFTVAPVDHQLMLCEIYGGKMDVEDAVIASGGAGTNTAVSFERQGLHAAAISEIGVDVAAQIIWDDLDREGVDTSFLIEEKAERTGISALLVAADGSRSAMTYRGAAHMLSRSDIPFDRLQTEWIHVSSIGNPSLIVELAAYCAGHHIHLSWNPSKAEAEELFLRTKLPAGRFADVLFLNDIEWAAVEQKASMIHSMVQTLVITKGKQGGVVYQGDQEYPYEATTGVSVVDETGAGDAFASGFVGTLIRGGSLHDAIGFGIENATGVIAHMGAKEGLLKHTT